MSHEKLPAVPVFKNALANYEISMRMGSHHRRMEQLKSRKQIDNQTVNKTICYKQLFDANPKKNYLLETKYTEIQRQNRLLFQKISKYNRKSPYNKSPSQTKNKQKSVSHHQFRSLNHTLRRNQIEQIQRENVKMFGRIQCQKPSISFRDTDRDYFQKKKISNRLSNIEKNRLIDWY